MNFALETGGFAVSHNLTTFPQIFHCNKLSCFSSVSHLFDHAHNEFLCSGGILQADSSRQLGEAESDERLCEAFHARLYLRVQDLQVRKVQTQGSLQYSRLLDKPDSLVPYSDPPRKRLCTAGPRSTKYIIDVQN